MWKIESRNQQMESENWNAESGDELECGKWKMESGFNFFMRVEERRKT